MQFGDWSSDVCSSDLTPVIVAILGLFVGIPLNQKKEPVHFPMYKKHHFATSFAVQDRKSVV